MPRRKTGPAHTFVVSEVSAISYSTKKILVYSSP